MASRFSIRRNISLNKKDISIRGCNNKHNYEYHEEDNFGCHNEHNY